MDELKVVASSSGYVSQEPALRGILGLAPPLPNFINSINDTNTCFALFSHIPVEIRCRIWQEAIVSRILWWTCTDVNGDRSNHTFTASRTLPLLSTCRESRESALLYGRYFLIPKSLSPKVTRAIWFSPIVDYFFLNPRWVELRPSQDPDLLKFLPFDIGNVRNMMVHPKYTDDRKQPSIALETFPSLEHVLVAAEEKAIGTNGKFMLASVYDLTKYFEAIKIRNPNTKMPHIAVGCLGWVGTEKWKIHHGDEDRRQLVSILESPSEMKEYSKNLREEKERFLNQSFGRKKTGFALKFRPGKEVADLKSSPNAVVTMSDELHDFLNPSSSNPLSTPPITPDGPPTYSQAISDDFLQPHAD